MVQQTPFKDDQLEGLNQEIEQASWQLAVSSKLLNREVQVREAPNCSQTDRLRIVMKLIF